jgi:hypothetical protein
MSGFAGYRAMAMFEVRLPYRVMVLICHRDGSLLLKDVRGTTRLYVDSVECQRSEMGIEITLLSLERDAIQRIIVPATDVFRYNAWLVR